MNPATHAWERDVVIIDGEDEVMEDLSTGNIVLMYWTFNC